MIVFILRRINKQSCQRLWNAHKLYIFDKGIKVAFLSKVRKISFFTAYSSFHSVFSYCDVSRFCQVPGQQPIYRNKTHFNLQTLIKVEWEGTNCPKIPKICSIHYVRGSLLLLQEGKQLRQAQRGETTGTRTLTKTDHLSGSVRTFWITEDCSENW